MEDLKIALIEAGKEMLRIIMCSIVPILIVYISGLDWKYAGIATAILRVIEKAYYYWQKSTIEAQGGDYSKISYKGLTGF